MLTVLGIFSMCGAFWMGCAMSMTEAKGAGWWLVGVYFAYVTGLLGCLAFAYRCFGGEF